MQTTDKKIYIEVGGAHLKRTVDTFYVKYQGPIVDLAPEVMTLKNDHAHTQYLYPDLTSCQ